MNDISYYEVLGLKSSCTQADIRTAYRVLAKKHHPDKGGNPELIELINKAYATLKNTNLRKMYDNSCKIKKQSYADFKSMKDQSIEFNKIFEHKTPESEARAKQEFLAQNDVLNKTIGYDPIDAKKTLQKREFEKRMSTLEVVRSQEDIEFTPDRLFDGDIAPEKFNAVFDMYKTTQEKDALIVHEGNPMAFESASALDDGGGCATFECGELNRKQLTKKDVSRISPVNYVKDHNVKSDDYTKNLEEKILERTNETAHLTSLPLSAYHTDIEMGGYGIMSGVAKKLKEIEYHDDTTGYHTGAVEHRDDVIEHRDCEYDGEMERKLEILFNECIAKS